MRSLGIRSLAAWLLLAVALAGGCATTPPPPIQMTHGQNVAIDPAAIPADEAMVEMLAPYAVEVAVLKAPIARCAVAMEQPDAEAPLGSWMADVSREEAFRVLGRPVDALFLNCGGIRAGIPEGEVSLFTFLQVMPFENEIVVFELTAAEVETLAAVFASRWAYFPISGMTIEASAEGKLERVLVGGAPLDPQRTYAVATSNYIAGGGDGMKLLTEFEPPLETGVLVREALIEHARRQDSQGKPISPPEDVYRYRFAGKTIQEIRS